MTFIVAGKYRASSKIGQGAFGKIFYGKNINTDEEVAIKVEEYENDLMLENEAKIYSYLKDTYGIPSLKACGKEGKFYYIIINLLGKSLEEKRIECGGILSLKTVLAMGLQMLRRIETVHHHGILHRDIKPENFLLGINKNCDVLHLIDFGLATPYKSGKSHINIKKINNIIGTARYASINIHDGFLPSRRDDIESIGYVLLFLLLGTLPWQGENDSDNIKRNKKIGDLKKKYCLWELDNKIPREIIILIEYARKLKFEEEPDYSYLKGLLVNLYKHKNFSVDRIYDWTPDIVCPK